MWKNRNEEEQDMEISEEELLRKALEDADKANKRVQMIRNKVRVRLSRMRRG